MVGSGRRFLIVEDWKRGRIGEDGFFNYGRYGFGWRWGLWCRVVFIGMEVMLWIVWLCVECDVVYLVNLEVERVRFGCWVRYWL